MQLVNVLAQPVVVPVLFGASPGSTSSFSAALKGVAVRNMALACGNYVAYWNGRLADGREAASGVYGVLLSVDGISQDSYKIYYKK